VTQTLHTNPDPHRGIEGFGPAVPTLRGLNMLNNNSPLESLAAFAIVFATGILSTVALGKYIEKVRRDAQTAAARAA
jgi:hypothetical protein